MPRRPLLAIVVSHDAEANEMHLEVMGSPELKINAALDAQVSLKAQQALASVSPSFNAELEAGAHMLENLERITTAEATARISDVEARPCTECALHRPLRVPTTINEVLLKEICLHCTGEIVAAYPSGSVEILTWLHRVGVKDHEATPRPR